MKNRKQPIIPISYQTTSKRSDDGGTGKKKIPAWQRRTLTFFLKYNRVIIAQCLAFLVFWQTKSYWFPSSNSSTPPNLSVVQEEILALRTIQKERRLEYDETVIDYFDRDAESKYYRWLDPKMTPPTTSTPDDFLEDGADNLMLETLRESRAEQKRLREELNGHQFKKLMREGLIEHFRDTGEPTDWHRKVDNFVSYQDADKIIGPRVDYTLLEYEYEELIASPPLLGGYPALEPLGDLLKRWPQDDLENPPQPYKEKLQRFNYSDPAQRQMAEKFRDNELPFKVYDIPEIDLANLKWTDAYLSHNFDRSISDVIDNPNLPPRAQGACLSSQDSFFSFFIPRNWFTKVMGPPPTVDTDNMSFEEWSQHARYADRVSLPRNERHFYYQSGVPREERYKPKKEWSFVSRDLPSFSDPGYTFFGFNPDEQKGIQCRFGERVRFPILDLIHSLYTAVVWTVDRDYLFLTHRVFSFRSTK